MAANVGDRPIVLGLRPEHFSFIDQAGPDQPTVNLAVQVVEPLGAQMDIYATLPTGQRVLARTEARPIQTGTTQRFALAIDKAQLFETGEYGKNLRA